MKKFFRLYGVLFVASFCAGWVWFMLFPAAVMQIVKPLIPVVAPWVQ